MMKLTCEFENLEEMIQFANIVSVNSTAVQEEGVKNPEIPEVPCKAAPVKTSEPVAAYSAQIAAATQLTPQEMTGQTAPQADTVSVPPVQVPTTSREYTLDELAGAAMTLMDKGMQVQLQELLSGYGVEALPMLPEEQFGSFATALRGLGAQI